MRIAGRICGLVLLMFVWRAEAADLTVEPLAESAPLDAVAADVTNQLMPTGFKVKSGGRTLCDIWLAKQWAVRDGFKPSNTILYPFEMGQLLGAVRFARKGGDFRGQEIEKGIYTLRYALQPEDGSHVGTSDTRDFLLLLKAEDDKESKTLTKEQLFKLSATAAGTTHPCMLSMLAPAAGESPSLEHLEQKEWWILRVAGKTKTGNQAVRFVVDGKAAE